MWRKNFVPCLDVIMIAFYPRNSTRKDDTSFFGVSTILIASFFFCCLESLSDSLPLTNNWLYWKHVHGSISLTCYYLPFIALQKESGLRMTVNRSSKFKMIWANLISIFVHLKSLLALIASPTFIIQKLKDFSRGFGIPELQV